MSDKMPVNWLGLSLNSQPFRKARSLVLKFITPVLAKMMKPGLISINNHIQWMGFADRHQGYISHISSGSFRRFGHPRLNRLER